MSSSPAATRDAMRYYRLWIYACNGALLLAVLVFAAAATRALADYRRVLVPGLGAAQPVLLYAYVALPAQAGPLQLLGCVAAARLSERLLRAYWLALLALLLADAAVGVVWAFRAERIRRELRPALLARLALDYPEDMDFSRGWDRLQREEECCGAVADNDFKTFNVTTPLSCCRVPVQKPCEIHTTPCAERLLEWLKCTAGILFVIGYCVVAFLKLCFVGILRCEIREMIQKIKLLRIELEAEGSGSDGSPIRGGPLCRAVVVSGGAQGGERAALLSRDDEPARKAVNGNNNCEMRELPRRTPTSAVTAAAAATLI